MFVKTIHIRLFTEKWSHAVRLIGLNPAIVSGKTGIEIVSQTHLFVIMPGCYDITNNSSGIFKKTAISQKICRENPKNGHFTNKGLREIGTIFVSFQPL